MVCDQRSIFRSHASAHCHVLLLGSSFGSVLLVSRLVGQHATTSTVLNPSANQQSVIPTRHHQSQRRFPPLPPPPPPLHTDYYSGFEAAPAAVTSASVGRATF
mmetsp:Transcript_40369/g.65397  ORF Transcript_40369/g.65397 Transcript_40369/m.65397 type:complete len:103 (-) Transcript_40369:530-838(-)